MPTRTELTQIAINAKHDGATHVFVARSRHASDPVDLHRAGAEALLAANVAEARGLSTVNAFGRRIPHVAQRQALTVTLIGLGAVVAATMAITSQSGFPLSRTLFEAFSAFGTVGLTTGITAQLPVPSQNLLILLMYLGRTGPITLATALALRDREDFKKLLRELESEQKESGGREHESEKRPN